MYADEAQEQKRLDALASHADTTRDMQQRKVERASQKKANLAWSDKVSRQGDRDIQKEKKTRKKKWLKTQEEKDAEEANPLKRARSEDEGSDKGEAEGDWAEMAKEERIAKKVRKPDMAFDVEFNP